VQFDFDGFAVSLSKRYRVMPELSLTYGPIWVLAITCSWIVLDAWSVGGVIAAVDAPV
jgi:hypothetical protein